MFSQKMKTIGTVPKSNRKIVETELKWIPLTTHSPELVHTLQ
jgi:hypothetical protein